MTAIDRLDAWLRISPSTVLPAEVLEYLDDVKAENDKLRDWCGEMLDSLMSEICATAHWCEEEDWHTCSDDSCGNYSFVIISRELGIECPHEHDAMAL